MFGIRNARRITIDRPPSALTRWGMPATGPLGRRVRVIELRRETADALSLMLEPEDGQPFAAEAGQYLTHCFEIDGRVVKRAYSLSSAQGEPLCCTVKLLPDGLASGFLASLRSGSSHVVLGPSGDFRLQPDEAGPLRFLAGGSGITPVIGLIETALARDPQRDIRLLYANHAEAGIIFASRLEALAKRHSSLRIVHALSERGERLDASRIAATLADDPPRGDARYYLCGPQGLMDLGEAALRAAGIPAAQILHERFLAAARESSERPTAPQTITFRRSGRSVQQQPGETLLDAGLRAGLALPFSCTVGGCAHCRIQVLQGRVAINEPNCLSTEERAAGYTLACSAYALEPVTLEF